MATRRDAREWALQLIFQLDFNPVAIADLDRVFAEFWDLQVRLLREKDEDSAPSFESSQRLDEDFVGADSLASPKLRGFTESLVRGVWGVRDEIDSRIESYTATGENSWPMHRMGSVDRNVLRLAIFEMFHSEETPPVVCINEAIDLAKYFSNTNSGAFVNGVLDRAKRDLTRPERTAAPKHRRRNDRSGK